jgi:hypothetical protein
MGTQVLGLDSSPGILGLGLGVGLEFHTFRLGLDSTRDMRDSDSTQTSGLCAAEDSIKVYGFTS